MKLDDINNYFGDMDLFLMDWILKGLLPESGTVLDVGCGDGRNGLYFIKNGYKYVGLDHDSAQIQLIRYLSQSFQGVDCEFLDSDIRTFVSPEKFDIIVCSRMLHFASDDLDFQLIWSRFVECLSPGGIIYLSMDSAIDSTLTKKIDENNHEFPDGKLRFVLTEERLKFIKKGFEEIEPLKTVVHHKQRAQSFLLLRKC